MTNKDLIEFCEYRIDCYSCPRRIACRIFYNKFKRSPYYFKVYPTEFNKEILNDTIRREGYNG